VRVRLHGVGVDLASRLQTRIAEQWPGLGGGDRDDVTIELDGLQGDAAWFAVALRLGVMMCGRQPDRPLVPIGTPRLSRRDLFGMIGLGRGVVRPLPRVIAGACQLDSGCLRCVEACPGSALVAVNGHLSLDDVLCLHCGLCVSACPVGALNHPPSTEDSVAVLCDVVTSFAASVDDIVLVFTCGSLPPQPWVAQVDVADIGTVGVRWLLRAAASGVAGVIVNCVDGSCVGSDAAREAVVTVASAIGKSGPVVRFVDGSVDGDVLVQVRESGHPVTPAGDAGVGWEGFVESIAAVARPQASVKGLGFTAVTVGPSCTSCGACARACDRGALSLQPDSSLTYLATACPGCGACVGACPEHCVTLTDSDAYNADVGTRVTVHTDEVVRCRLCGQPVGPKSMLLKVGALLGSPGHIDDLCASCKQH